MKRLGIFVLIACVAGLLFHMLFPSMTFRYRLVLDATDGAKQVTGSTVLSVTYSKNHGFGGVSSTVGEVNGEAMTLALSRGVCS